MTYLNPLCAHRLLHAAFVMMVLELLGVFSIHYYEGPEGVDEGVSLPLK